MQSKRACKEIFYVHNQELLGSQDAYKRKEEEKKTGTRIFILVLTRAYLYNEKKRKL